MWPAFAVKKQSPLQTRMQSIWSFDIHVDLCSIQSRPRSIVSLLYNDIVRSPNDIKYLFVLRQWPFPDSCQEIFPTRTQPSYRHILHATEQLSKDSNFALVVHFSFSISVCFLSCFRSLWKAYRTNSHVKRLKARKSPREAQATLTNTSLTTK